ncbi:MAG: type IV pilus secretin PilQ [Sulfuritalea sp.]|jgi:type IV pilus assembly protein PilQ|nr:type IV pilus secretin PilQ [Sulfuritalea sp.]MDP1982381.1 type IV pilus secretin PilQ [Sulfuritalea sp.]
MNKFHIAALAMLGFCVGLSGTSFAAENSIKQVQVRRDGDQVLLKVQMAAPLKSLPGNWSVVEPPRVVIDFPETDNQSGQSSQQVAEGDLKSLNLVQTDKLTRLVLNLYRPTKFSTEIVGDALFIKLQAQSVQASQEAAPSVYQAAAPMATAAKPVQGADTAAIRDIAFRRGEDGQATITVDLTDGTVPIDIRRTGTGISVELRDVELPERLQNRRDVNDFATPVTTITSRGLDNLTRLDITARGRWFHQAHLANNQLTIEVKPIPADEANKLVQTGQQGQKISINFFGADASMVLRTLADISGKNVLIDPSLNGRTVTANLDNIPYDQALEIIMAQVNAGMRVRNEVVFFGDRAVLQKRDQDTADELTRANDIAPLVAETFKLNYVKASDIVTLVNSSFAPSTALAGAAAPAAGAAPANPGGGAAPAGGSSARGMLTARGGMSIHDATNQVFVRDTATVVEAIREVIRNVDIPPKQVLIEARIVEASTGFASSLGVRLGAFNMQTGGYVVPGTNTRAAFGTTMPTSFENVDVFGNNSRMVLNSNSTVFRPSYNLASAANFGLMLFNTAATKLITLELQAAENDSRNKTVSSPRILTLNRKPATISFTQTQTYSTGFNATTGLATYSTISAPLSLGVTPSVNPDNRISLELNIAKSTLIPSGVINIPPGVNTNTVTTNAIVENGGTVVIGGFSTETETQSQERVPFLGDLPYVGFLFKTTAKNQSRSELLVFITPRIVSEALTQR